MGTTLIITKAAIVSSSTRIPDSCTHACHFTVIELAHHDDKHLWHIPYQSGRGHSSSRPHVPFCSIYLKGLTQLNYTAGDSTNLGFNDPCMQAIQLVKQMKTWQLLLGWSQILPKTASLTFAMQTLANNRNNPQAGNMALDLLHYILDEQNECNQHPSSQ